MVWSIHYRHRGMIGYRSAGSVELAIEQACAFLEQGADVRAITSDAGHKTIGADEIRATCAHRAANLVDKERENS